VKVPWVALAWGLLACALTALHEGALWLPAPDLLSLFTCHLAHLSLTQLVLAGGTTVLLLALLEREQGQARTLGALALISAVVALGVVAGESGRITAYLGASGLAHGLAALWLLGATPDERRVRRPLLVLLVVKVAYEAVTQHVPGAMGLAGGVPVPSAHALGFAAGAALGVAAARGGLNRIACAHGRRDQTRTSRHASV
jgi:membrane associated rhomboid family serine protease